MTVPGGGYTLDDLPRWERPGNICGVTMSRHSDDFFELAVREAGLGVWDWDVVANRVTWSRETYELLGVTPESFGGTYEAYLALLSDIDRERVSAAVDAALTSGDRYQIEHGIQRPDGRVGWLAVVGKVVRDEAGEPKRMLGVLKDITERQLAEQRLRESEERFRSLAEASVEAIVFGAQGRVLDVNSAAVRMLRCDSPADLVGRSIGEFVHPDDLQLVQKHLQAGRKDSYVHRALCKDGSVVYVEATGRQVTYRGAQVRMTALRDVTVRVEAEAKLRQRDEFIRSIVETSRDWIWAVDDAGQNTYSNPAGESILGYALADLRRGSAFRLMHPADQERVQTMMRDCVAQRRGWDRVLIRWRHADGAYRTLESSAVPILDEDGAIVGFRGVDRDITDRLDMEAAQQRLEEQLRHAQKMEAVGQLAGGIAHDFNNLLSVISGNLQILRDLLGEHVGEEAAEELAEIEQAAERAVTLTSQLLAFSRRQVSQPAALDLNQVLGRLRGLLVRLLSEKIRLRMRTDAMLPNVFADAGQLEQVIVNLAVNARDAMPEGGTLTLQTCTREVSPEDAAAFVEAVPGRFVVLLVTDTGTGMAPEMARRIFEPFFTTKAVGQGTGLGLSTAYGIVRQAGGFITVDGEFGRGSTFAVYLPVSDLAPTLSLRPVARADRLQGQETVLVCEDDPAVRRLAVRMLSRAGYHVLEASDGEEALRAEAAHSGPIAVLLTDVIMPKMNGRELSTALVARRPEVKTIYFSGYPADVISDQGVLDEDVEFLQKPFVRQELLARLRQVIDDQR